MKFMVKAFLLYLFWVIALFSYAGPVEPIFVDKFENDDSLGITITQNSTYLMPGQMFKLSIFAQCNKPYQIKTISIGGQAYEWKEDRVFTYGFPVASVGSHDVPINVQFINKKGQVKYKAYTLSFTVGQANASVSLDKMNVLYTGIDNPIRIAATGGGDDKLTVSIEGGRGMIAKLGSGRYNVRVNSITDECIITVSVDDKIAGRSLFRVREIPLPVGKVGSFESGDSISRSAFLAQSEVVAGMKDFPFDLHHVVTGFTLTIHKQGSGTRIVNNKGGMFSMEAKKIMQEALLPGVMVTISNLYGKAMDGEERRLLPLVYFIKVG
ncbi:MAG: hypothetical protein EOO13_18370 [Chitinophagaceae bacterium]|nr:MAG: hypothetical protein EOO13_18370 [Chitinophagaceae bacterium]